MRRAVFLCAAILALTGGWGMAQSPDPLNARWKEAAIEARAAALHSRQLAQQARRATGEAARARAQAEALVADIESIEANITQQQLRFALIEKFRAEQRTRLAARQQPLIGLTAALQAMARHPPALALLQRGSIENSVRLRMMLAAALPAIRQKTASLRTEMAVGERLRTDATNTLGALAASRKALRQQRIALARHEAQQLSRSAGLTEAALSEIDRSMALGEEARTLAQLVRTRTYQAKLAARLASLPAPLLRPSQQTTPKPTVTRYRPAFYLLPVAGQLTIGAGELSDAGVHARGLSFITIADQPVVAPRAGRIIYAGRFRSYGETVIIDHGKGWTSTITHMIALRVRQGDSVRQNDPIGRSGRQLTVELRYQGHPQSITALIS